MKKIIILIAILKLVSNECSIVSNEVKSHSLYQNMDNVPIQGEATSQRKGNTENQETWNLNKTIDFESSAFTFKPSSLLSSFLDSCTKESRNESIRNDKVLNFL